MLSFIGFSAILVLEVCFVMKMQIIYKLINVSIDVFVKGRGVVFMNFH